MMWDLNNSISTAGWVLTEAYAINGSGQIVGTGSLNGAAAEWLIATGRAPKTPYWVSQGTCIGRQGRVRIDCIDGKVWVGGSVRVVVSGGAVTL